MGGLPDLLMSPLIRVPFNLHTLFFLSLFSFRVRIISELPNQSLACDSLSDSSRDPIMWFIMWFIMWLISFPYRWLTKPWDHVTTRSPFHTCDLPCHEVTWQPDLLSIQVTSIKTWYHINIPLQKPYKQMKVRKSKWETILHFLLNFTTF